MNTAAGDNRHDGGNGVDSSAPRKKQRALGSSPSAAYLDGEDSSPVIATPASAEAPTNGNTVEPTAVPHEGAALEQRLFESWDEFDRFMDEYGRRTFQLFRKRTSTSVKLRNRRMLAHAESMRHKKTGGDELVEPPRLFPEHYGHYSLTLVCTHNGAFVSRGTGKRSRQAVRAKDCYAQVNACLKLTDPRCNRYHVCITRALLTHSHPLDRETFQQYSNTRLNLSESLLECVELMRKAAVKPRDVRTYIMAHSNCSPTIKDVRNLLNRLRSREENAEQQQEQQEQQEKTPVALLHPEATSVQQDTPAPDGPCQSSATQTQSTTPSLPVEPTMQFQLAHDMGKRVANLLAGASAAEFPHALRVLELAENIVRGQQTSSRQVKSTAIPSVEAFPVKPASTSSQTQVKSASSRLETLEDVGEESQ